MDAADQGGVEIVNSERTPKIYNRQERFTCVKYDVRSMRYEVREFRTSCFLLLTSCIQAGTGSFSELYRPMASLLNVARKM